jgi:hypothetical protein
MSETQYTLYQIQGKTNSRGNADADEDADAAELTSSVLSADDMSESSFDADDCLDVIEQEEESRKKPDTDETKPSETFKIGEDGDLSKLMSMPPSEIVRRPVPTTKVISEKSAQAAEKKKEREKLIAKKVAKQSALIVRDARFATNVMPVRRALRDAYRNLPFTDFVSFINFLLRGLKRMKHVDAAKVITYWHSDDPVISHVLGAHCSNQYPKMVLEEMGFVCVFECYWVWPEKHLKPNMGHNISRLVPAHCPGLQKVRLADLIKLVTHCRKSLEKYGKSYTGHCRNA